MRLEPLWISGLIKEAHRAALLLPCENTAGRSLRISSSPDSRSAGTLILDYPVSGTVRNKYLLMFVSQPVYGVFVVAAHAV